MITIRGLKKIYADNTVLNIDELTLCDGLRYALVGANGSGKSTLCRIVAGLETFDEGEVIEQNVSIAYMPQKPFAFNLTVKRNITLGLEKKSQPDEQTILKLGLTPLLNRKATRLSGGETQRMALCRTLFVPCNSLVLDEPTSSMDVEYATVCDDVIAQTIDNKRKNNSLGVVLIATHSAQQVKRLSDFVIILDKGRVAEAVPSFDFETELRSCAGRAFAKFAYDKKEV